MLSSYFMFDGNCREAVEFYAMAFGQELPEFTTYGEITPPDPNVQVPDEAKSRIVNAIIIIAGTPVMFCDVPFGMEFIKGNHINPVVNSSDTDWMNTVFTQLSKGGTVDMPLAETFYSKLYGMVTDMYGITWHLNYDDAC